MADAPPTPTNQELLGLLVTAWGGGDIRPGSPEHWTIDSIVNMVRSRMASTTPSAPQPQPPAAPLTHVHRKSGGRYALLGEGRLQSDTPLGDMSEIAIYQGEDGRLWARDTTEFGGRFDPITTHKDAPS